MPNLIYAMRAKPVQGLSGGWFNAATADYVSLIDDGGGDVLTRFEPVLAEPLSLNRRLNLLGGGRRAVPSFGTIELLNDAGALDDLVVDWLWWSGQVEIRRGAPSSAWEDLTLVFSGRVAQVTGDLGRVRIGVRDPVFALQKELQTTFYAGTGGLEGGDELKNAPKPLLYGICRNVQPVLVDAANLKYQVHDGTINAVSAVYVNGSAWSYDATPGAGEYSYDLSTGIITLGGSPPGVVTADIEGEATTAYVEDLDDLLVRILVDRAGFVFPDDFGEIDLPAAPFGFYFTEAMTIEDALGRLAAAGGFWWGFSRAGLLDAAVPGRLRAVTAPVLDEALVGRGIACTAAPVPVYRVAVDYLRTWRVLTDDEVAGGVSAAEKARLTRGSSSAVVSGISGAALKLLTGDTAARLNVAGCYDVEADAVALATELKAWFSPYQREWTLALPLDDVPAALADIDVGDTVTVQIDRFGLDAGEDFFVDGIAENGRSRSLTLTLVG